MPSTTNTLPSGNTLRVKKTVIAKTLTDSAASSIGLAKYYHRYVNCLQDLYLKFQLFIELIKQMKYSSYCLTSLSFGRILCFDYNQVMK